MMKEAADDKHGKREKQIRRGMFVLILTVCGIVGALAIWQHKAHIREKKHLHGLGGIGSLRKKNLGSLKEGIDGVIPKLHTHHHHNIDSPPHRSASALKNAIHHHHHHDAAWKERINEKFTQKLKREDGTTGKHLLAHKPPDVTRLNVAVADQLQRTLAEVRAGGGGATDSEEGGEEK